MSEIKPLVAIHCLVYNHEPYLRDCFEGFVMQQTNFPFVAIVHDDASTDGSAAIIREYEEKFPHIFKPIYEIENQFLKTDRNFSALLRIMNAAIDEYAPKYIAFCEGDDYWTDPYKLQKQVDFMEKNEFCTVCFHRYDIFDQDNTTWGNDICSIYIKNADKGVKIDTEMYFEQWVTQPLTMLCRSSLYREVVKNSVRYKYFKDTHMIYHLIDFGYGYIMNFKGGVYRKHNGGIHSKTSLCSQCDIALKVAKELYKVNKTPEVKSNLIRTLDWTIEEYIRHRWNAIVCVNEIFYRFFYSGSLKKLVKSLIRIVSKKYTTVH